MNGFDQNNKSGLPLFEILGRELEKSVELISTIDDVSFRHNTERTGSIGAQLRHNLDVVNALVNGIAIGRVDYSDRKRDPLIENNRDAATRSLRTAIDAIRRIPSREYPRSILVRSESDPFTWLPSSIVREVEYVLSHAVHHHALIAEKAGQLDIKVSKDLGVAASTLACREQKAA